MYKSMVFVLGLTSAVAFSNAIPVKDNGDIALTLSQSNYNRIKIKDDKIIKVVFPSDAMSFKRDDQDGSIYVMPAITIPFTLFLSTENGHHFSINLSGQDSLGKTIELIPQQVAVAKTAKVQTNPSIPTNVPPDAILALLNHMEERKPFSDVVIKRQSADAQLWSKGLKFKPRETWDDKDLTGEIIELYNGGKEPLKLESEWFAKASTLAIKFSKPLITPGETALLYRVEGVGHG